MRGPGSQEYLPVVQANLVVVSHHQRLDDAAVGLVCQYSLDTLLDMLSRVFLQITRPPNRCGEFLTAWIAFYTTGSANICTRRPRVEVKSMRISRAVGSLEPHHELPALAGME